MNPSAFVFQIPALYRAALESGELVRVGALLKDAATGKIVTHLQESGIAHSLLSKTIMASTGPLGLATETVNMASGIYTAVQVTQLKSMIAALQVLQYATLGVSLVGVGVSVAGFVYMHKRFNALDCRIDELMKSIHSGFAIQHEATLRAHISQTKGLIKAAGQAPTLSRPEMEYARVAEAMSEQAAYFEGELEFLITMNGKINVEIFWQLAQLLMLSNSIRIDCRLRCNELRNAREIAESVGNDYQRIFDPLSIASFHSSSDNRIVITKTLREITDAALTKPYLIEYLRTQRINGAEYLQRLESETESPILMLQVN